MSVRIECTVHARHLDVVRHVLAVERCVAGLPPAASSRVPDRGDLLRRDVAAVRSAAERVQRLHSSCAAGTAAC